MLVSSSLVMLGFESQLFPTAHVLKVAPQLVILFGNLLADGNRSLGARLTPGPFLSSNLTTIRIDPYRLLPLCLLPHSGGEKLSRSMSFLLGLISFCYCNQSNKKGTPGEVCLNSLLFSSKWAVWLNYKHSLRILDAETLLGMF